MKNWQDVQAMINSMSKAEMTQAAIKFIEGSRGTLTPMERQQIESFIYNEKMAMSSEMVQCSNPSVSRDALQLAKAINTVNMRR
ncbi:hypothetical protein [Cellulosilyticum sp. I15G10I2]|uniref:hypothetical protein n=1 Tax=Cellulosilyticum sp. I15G10I2 TaxID=1892843 RepID=UPI00085C75F7|nr:hypothetical protein [Cellulosilyticum sp. I15G10I2]